jgi:hypothetical protein
MGRVKIYALAAGFIAVAAVALLLALVVIPGSAAAPDNDLTAAVPAGSSGGITVHGHWTMDVLDPDGSLVEHREFENSLQSGGKEILSHLLSRSVTPGKWTLYVSGGPIQPCVNNGNANTCYICEANDDNTGTAYFKNLTLTRSGTGDLSKLILSGSFTATNTSSIHTVISFLVGCSGSTSPEACAGTVSNKIFGSEITRATITPNIAVQAGQQVQVTVELSFQ